MYSNLFQPCILEPTKVVLSSRPSLTDNIYTNTYDKKIHSGNSLDKVRDHMPNFCILEDTYKVKKNRKIRIRDIQQFEKDKFLKDLEELKNIDLLQYKDCNIMYNKFHEKYLQIIDKNISYKTLSKKETKLKNFFFKKQDIFWYERYKFYRNRISKLISKSKKIHLRKFFQDNFENSRDSWKKKLMNYSIGNQKKNDDIVINENGAMICNQKVVSNKFNNYLSMVPIIYYENYVNRIISFKTI